MNYKLLIVDDEPDILQALETYLSLQGYEVYTTTNPKEALDRIGYEKYHVALLDINMPKMSGIEMLKRIRMTRPTVQVVMMTAYTTIEKAIECIENGASDYMLKPFTDMEELASIIQLTCDRVRRWEIIARESLQNPQDSTAHRL